MIEFFSRRCVGPTLGLFITMGLSAMALAWPPETIPQLDPSPRPVEWVEPAALDLPSDENLQTITVKDRTFTITRISKAADTQTFHRWQARQGEAPAGFDANAAFASYEKPDEALSFVGSGTGGKRSAERLVVQGCTFIIDFQEGNFEKFNPRRSAIYVEGYKEVLVRDCVFISKSRPSDPLRKTIASIYAADCVKVQVQDCYFAGRTTGWRGHINLWGCGPSDIRNCEIDGRKRVAGGVWVATGVGEGKIGFPHEGDDPSLSIYPPGPLRVENCYIHDQVGKENSDGIYIQSVRPYLVRNCKVSTWGDDSLIDAGFRDTSKKWGDGFLPNHGGMGIVEHCEFSNGWIKDSVGMGGGMIFRNNLVKNAWFFPYAFDGGSWYVVGNRFDPMARVVLSGKNGQTDGWTPGEGMFAKGGKMLFFNNYVKSGAKVAAIFVAGAKPAPVATSVVSDYNVFDMAPPATWAIEFDKSTLNLEQWRERTGNDKNSRIGAGSLDDFKQVDPKTVKLPGGVEMKFGAVDAGLSGPVGVRNPAVLQRALPLLKAFDEELRAESYNVDPETVPVTAQTAATKKESRPWASGGGYQTIDAKNAGDSITFRVPVTYPGRYYVTTLAALPGSGNWRLAIDDKPIGEAFALTKRGGARHGVVDFTAGEHAFTFTAVDAGARLVLDAVRFDNADLVEQQAKRQQEARGRAEAAKQAKAAIDASKIKFAIPELPVVGKTKGHLSESVVKGRKYRLWQASAQDVVMFEVEVPKAGTYAVSIQTANQTDKGVVQLIVDKADAGKPAKLAGTMSLGDVTLTEGNHSVGLRLIEPKNAKDLKVRLERLDLLAQDKANQPAVEPPAPQPDGGE